MNQYLIGLIGLFSIFLVTRENRKVSRWGNFVGLFGQPFWLIETWRSGQWGMFALSLGYTIFFLHGCTFLLENRIRVRRVKLSRLSH
jgi:hypothetical protein